MESESQTKSNWVNKNSPLFHFIYEADWALGRLIAIILRSCLFLALLILALIFLVAEIYNIIEYREGLADISTLEAVFVVFLIVLVKRYLVYTKKTGLRWWDKITTPLIWFGKFVLIVWFAVSIIAFADLVKETDFLRWALLRSEHYSQIVAFTCILLSLYISVPSKKQRIKIACKGTENNMEPQSKSTITLQEKSDQTMQDI
ncbi:hypothetical protein RND59_16600 [Vibrio ruber]|uniref:hypothetical protein n=1 Tax=Vibrio ruber TaxID=184755 RepID=UPI002892B616|nr:hypothetical protein [Vibrio ruber]WNJ97746.1 hypothetical protein RND59_16600 [Vibrio ruber]